MPESAAPIIIPIYFFTSTTFYKMPQTISQPNINYLFQDQIPNFAHLVTTEPQTKEQFMQTVKDTYSLDNPKTAMFYGAIERSSFETIRINHERTRILFNQ